ncbi:MAG: hypothetical protein WCP30_15925 [Mycobacteriaceae bacterium]
MISVAAAGLTDAAGATAAVSLRDDRRATTVGAPAVSVDLAPGVGFGAKAVAAGCGAVERPATFVVRGPSTWVSVWVSAAAMPDPPVIAAPANAAPNPTPTAPAPSHE